MARVRFNTLKFLRKHYRGLSQGLVGVFIISVLLTLPKVATSLQRQIFVDNIISGTNPDWATGFFILGLFLLLFEFVLRIYDDEMWQTTLRISINATSELLWHILHLPMSFFHDKYAGDLASKVSMPSEVAQQVMKKVVPVISEFILLFVYLFFMIKYNMVLALFAVVHILLNIGILRSMNKRRVDMNKQMQNEIDNLQGFTTSSISNIEAIKGAGAESGFFQRWVNMFALSQNASIKCSTRNIYAAALPSLFKTISNTLVLGIGAYYIMQGHMTIGMLMAFQGFLDGTMVAMNKISLRFFQSWSKVKARCEIMDEILTEPTSVPRTIEDQRPIKNGKLGGRIEMRHITFGYVPDAPPLISDFSLTLDAGKTVAFVGLSGCGKSTLSKLVSGLYEPWSGQILFDGVDSHDVNRNVFNNSVAMVDQNIVLFDGTVADNVKLWDESIEDFAMIFACHDAQIHEEIASRSNAYDSTVENGGMNFSGGQRQRLEIASALAKEPTILIMDEGTSALDAVTEERVMRAIKDMGITLIMVAHRLSTIRDCDEIVVLDKGMVVERGTHEELMKHEGGLYRQLVETS